MKKSLKSIARSMKVSAKCQLRNNAMYADAITHSWENLQINKEHLKHSREANRIVMKRFELEHLPFVSVLEGLLKMIPVQAITGVEQQEIVDEAKRMIRLMKSAQEKP